jgi:hypothetical protein
MMISSLRDLALESNECYKKSVPSVTDPKGCGHTQQEGFGRWFVMLVRPDPFRDLDRLTQQLLGMIREPMPARR